MLAFRKGKGEVTEPLLSANTDRNLSVGMLQSYSYLPVDFVNCEIVGYQPEYFLESKSLVFTPVLTEGCIIKKYYAINNGMKISISVPSNRTTISGSIHKFWNEGKHNHNDFDEYAFLTALNNLCEWLGIMPENMAIKSLEYGVNIKFEYPVAKVLNHCLQHKRVDIEQGISSDKGKYHKAKHSQFILKLYDKGLQYKLHDNIMRIENKQTNWSPYRKLGIVTMKDFIQWDKLELVENLIEQWESVVFYDFTSAAYRNCKDYSNQNWWRELRDTKSRTTFKRHFDKLRQMNEQKGMDIQGKISKLIISKINELQGVTNFNLHQMHNDSEIIMLRS
jgi:hypothetical protein